MFSIYYQKLLEEFLTMYDVIIIGAGTAGISAYKEALKRTSNLLIINDGPWDTTCARVGCMPSKVLISSANRAHEMQNLDGLGIRAKVEIDTSQVMQHVQQLRDRFTRATLKDVDSWPAEHKISGRAEFINHNTVQVNGTEYQANSFILAVGSTPAIDDKIKQELGEYLISSDDIFELKKLPQSLAVIGSGVIAIELAQAMHRLGVKTDIFARSRKVGTLSSSLLQTQAQVILSQELNLHFETLPKTYKKTEAGVEINFVENNQNQTLTVDYVLSATGRKSLLNTLKLENIDPKFSDLKDIEIDPVTKQINDLAIYIVGDAHTTTPIQHEAAHAGRNAIQHCFSQSSVDRLNPLTPIGIVFSSPQMASVGLNSKQLKESNIAFVTGVADYSRQGRAIVNAQNQGAVEIYVDIKTRKILGAEFFIYSAEHLAHLLAWLIDEDATLDDALNKPFYHPTIEEGLRTALKHARRQLSLS